MDPAEAGRELESREIAATDDEFRRRYVSGDVEIVRLLLAAGVDPNLDGGQALILAAARGWVEMTRLLLDAGAEPDPDTRGGLTALTNAVINRETEVVSMLLEVGASANARGPGGTTALMFATDAAAVELLLAAGASPDAQDARGQTPLMNAISLGDEEIVGRLLAAGANPELVDRVGRTPLLVAKALAFDTIVDQLRAAGAAPLIRPFVAPGVLERYVGSYGSEEAIIYLALDRGHLFLVEEAFQGSLYEAELIPLDETTFYRDRDPAALPFRFEFDDQGGVAGLRSLSQTKVFFHRLPGGD